MFTTTTTVDNKARTNIDVGFDHQPPLRSHASAKSAIEQTVRNERNSLTPCIMFAQEGRAQSMVELRRCLHTHNRHANLRWAVSGLPCSGQTIPIDVWRSATCTIDAWTIERNPLTSRIAIPESEWDRRRWCGSAACTMLRRSRNVPREGVAQCRCLHMHNKQTNLRMNFFNSSYSEQTMSIDVRSSAACTIESRTILVSEWVRAQAMV